MDDELYKLPIIGQEDEEDYTKLPVVSSPEEDDLYSLPISSPEEYAKEAAHGLTRNEIMSNAEKMESLRKYMVQRKGVDWENKNAEEVFDTYMTHMRNVNVNEVNTVGEALFIQRATAEQKAAAAEAYNVYEEIAPFWSSGEGAGAVYDYGKAILFSPSTWLGAGLGKGLTMIGAQGAKEAVLAAAKAAALKGGPEAAKAVIASSVRNQAIKVGAIATGVDATLSMGQDYIQQAEVEMEAGSRDEYSVLQTALVGLTGAVGGALSIVPEVTKAAKGVGFDAEDIAKSKALRKSRAAGLAAPRIKAAVAKMVEGLDKPVLGSGSMNWKEAVARGEGVNPSLSTLTDNMNWFFDVDNPDSLVRIIVDSGANLERKEGEPFTEAVLGFMTDLPEDQLDEINKVLEPATGIKLGQLVDLIATGQSKAGTVHNVASQASKYAQDYANLMKATKQSNKAVMEDFLKPKDVNLEDPEYARYAASLWRRMLVSHPATTAVNIKGWGAAYTAGIMSGLVNGTMLGTTGVIGKALGKKWGTQALKEAKASGANQIFKAKTFMDPYGSKEGFLSLLEDAPRWVQDRMTAEAFGGIAHETTPEMFGIKPNMFVRGVENTAEAAAKVSLIKQQDLWTKTFSGIADLDLQVRREYGKSLSKLVADGESHKITDDMWSHSMKILLQDTFSMDYTKGKGLLNGLANITEKISNLPYAGFLFPFGRFINTNMAFTLQYSPLAFIPAVGKLRKLGIEGFTSNTDDVATDISKAIVGTVGLGMMINESEKLRENGHQWFEAIEDDGTAVNKQTEAPRAQFQLLGRIGDRLKNGEAVPKELWTELVNQLAAGQWLKEVTSGDTPIAAMINLMASDKIDEEERASYGELIGAALQSVSGQILSGYTRPLDFPNKIAGLVTEKDATIDRRQAESPQEAVVLELTRYTDNLFEALLGDEIGTPLRSATRPEGDVHDPNAFSTLIGRKEVLPKNYIDKALGMVDMPAYLLDQRTGIPQADRFVNEKVAPILNARAKELLQDPSFNRLSTPMKTYRVKNMLRLARKDIKTMLGKGMIGSGEDRLDDTRRLWLSQPAPLRDQAKKDLGITTEDKELTEGEILALREHIGLMKKFFDKRDK